MSIKTIIFDLGNVLVNYDLQKFINPFVKKVPDLKIENLNKIILEYSELAASYEKGLISSLEFFETLKKETHYGGNFNEFAVIWNDVFKEPSANVLEIAAALSGDYKIGVLSNTNELHIGFLEKRYPGLFNLFDKLFYSYEMHLRKPDAAIYKKVISDLGAGQKEIVFIDDLAINIETANNNGMVGLLFENAHKLKNDLREKGVKI